MTVAEFAGAMHAYGMLTGASVTSWGRTTARNAAVGGVPYSSHRFWLGCDVVYDEGPPGDGALLASRLGLKLIREGDHDHLQPDGWPAG